ncbi:hypothetical protein ACROYT_G002927 [Oculina patagonica]
MAHYAGMRILSIYINIIRDLYDHSSSCVLEGKQTSDWFEVPNNIARTALDWAPEGKLKKTRQTSNDLEEKRGEEAGRNGLDLMGRCNNSCKRSRGVESNFEWPQASSGARRG